MCLQIVSHLFLKYEPNKMIKSKEKLSVTRPTRYKLSTKLKCKIILTKKKNCVLVPLPASELFVEDLFTSLWPTDRCRALLYKQTFRRLFKFNN